jgi:hypothetical protein
MAILPNNAIDSQIIPSLIPLLNERSYGHSLAGFHHPALWRLRHNTAFIGTLGRLGWKNGRNIRVEYRRTGGAPDRTKSLAADLVRA